jgi:hypothetical protein
MALQQLIQNFVSKKEKIRAGEPAFELEAPERPRAAAPNASRGAVTSTVGDDDDNRARFGPGGTDDSVWP